MAQSRVTVKRIGKIFLCLLLLSPIPIAGQFVLPFLYTPLRSLFSDQLPNLPKHKKVTSQHVRISESWTAAQTYSQTMADLITKVHILLAPPSFTAANLADLDYSWSYNISINAVNPSSGKTAGLMQEELLKFVGQKFLFDVNNVASRLGIPTSNLWNSYDPANWETVVHAIISESSSAFSRRLALPSLNSLAELVHMQTQGFLNVNLSRFEDIVFPFITKKAILDANITSYLINTSAIIHGGSYNNVTVAKVLQLHKNLTLSFKQFGILYNLTIEQVKAIGEATFYEIFRLCGVSTETILQVTLPEVAWRVVGSVHITPPCPVLIAIKGKSIASHDSVINPQTTTVLEILTAVSNLTWREVREAVSASLPDWEFLDSVTLPQLAEISGISLETLLNGSASQAVELVFRLRTDGSLNNKTEIHRAFIQSLVEEKSNLSLSEVANLTQTVEASFSNAPSSRLFRSFLNATITYFGLNLSEIVASVQMSEVALDNLPRQEWNNVFSAIVNPVVRSEAALLQISTTKLIQYLGIASVELTISQLKEFMTNQILFAKRRKRKFENDPISAYLSQNSVSDAKYLDSTVFSLVLGASGFSSDELKLIYGLNSDEIFVLASLRVSELPLYCALNTTGLRDRTSFNITAEIAGINGDQAVCRSVRFYIAARFKNMSVLQTEFSPVINSSISFVNLVETVTGLPWRQNVWALGVEMEHWTVLYVLNQVSYVEVTSGLILDPYQSRTLLQIFQASVQLYQGNNSNLRLKIRENRNQTLKILYELFNTNEDELIQLIPETKNQYDDFYPIQVFSRMIQHYLVGKFNVSVSNLESSLDLNPGDLNKLAPTEWPEMIPFVKAEVIRSGQNQLGVSLSNFARLLNQTPQSVQSLTFAQLEFKWDSVISRLEKGKAAFDTHSVFQIISAIGISNDSLNDVTVLQFIEGRINVTKSEMLLLYNFSSIAIGVLSNYTFLELPGFCALTKENLLNRRPVQIVVSLLGHDGDMSCRKIAAVALASTITVTELAAKFSLGVKDNISLLTLFEDLFTLPWPKIAWAINASLPDWPTLGAVSLDNVATLTSQSRQNMKSQKSFREITMQLSRLPSNSYAQLMNTYRSKLMNQASALFGVNAYKICDGCEVVDILWNSLTQLHLLIDFDPYKLPNGLNVSFYEFNLTVPSQWPLLVQPIVRDAYVKTALALGIDRARLSSLSQITTVAVLSMNLTQYQAFLSQSIQPLIVAKTALTSSPLAELIAAKGLRLSALANVSVFDVIDAVLSVSVQNISFIFNWTTEQQAKLKDYTLDDMTYYKGVELHNLGRESLLTQVEYILERSLPTRTPPPLWPPHCKRGFDRAGDGSECKDNDECSTGICGDDSLCENYIGGFNCQCRRPGYFTARVNESCKPCKTYTGFITINNMEYGSYLKDRSTERYFDEKEKFEAAVDDEFMKSTVSQYYYGCRVQEFRRGSVVVEFLIFTTPDFAGSRQDLENALLKRVTNSYLGPYNVTSSQITVEDYDECKAQHDTCEIHATCVNKEGTFECQGSSTSQGWVVVVVVVLTCVIFLLTIVIALLIWRRRRAMPSKTRRNVPNTNIDNEDNHNTNRDLRVIEEREYMELSHMPTDEQSRGPSPYYQCLQGTNVTSDYYNEGHMGRNADPGHYNVGFMEGDANSAQHVYEGLDAYDDVGCNQ